MQVLREVFAWPPTRDPQRPWAEDPDLAAFLASSRAVFDLVTAETLAIRFTAHCSQVQFMPEDRPLADGSFGVAVFAKNYPGFDMVRVAVPRGATTWPADDRTRASLDVIMAGLRAVGEQRGWDLDALDKVRRRVLARGLRFRWASA